MNMSFESNILSHIVYSIENYSERNAFCIANKFYNYKYLGERVSAIRAQLRQISSACDDEPVCALAIHDDIDTYASIIALWMEGKAYVALHPNQPIDRNINIIQQVGLHYIFDSAKTSDFTDWVASNEANSKYFIIPTSECEYKELYLHDWKQVTEETLAYVLFTSGSTGVPKGVPLSRGNLSAFIEAFWDLGYVLTKEDRCLQCFDLTFDLSVVSYVVPLLVGACMYTIPYNKIKWSYTYVLLEDYELTFALMTPSTIQYLLPYMKDIYLPKMRYSLFCGEALPTKTTQEWAKCIPNAYIDNVYGPTEDTIFCTAYRFQRDGANVEHNGVLSIGTSMSSGQVIIVDDNNMEVKGNDIGELCLSGKQLTQGYWNNPEKTAEAFFTLTDNDNQVVRYYHSGDLCYYGEGGNILFVGRKDSQVKINGYRIELGEIEFHARKFIPNVNVIVMAYNDALGNTAIALFIEQQPMDATPILDYLKSLLPHYMLPTKVVYVPNFPVNSSNKIDRSKLKQLL